MQYAPPTDRPPILGSIVAPGSTSSDDESRKEDRFDVSRRYIPMDLVVGDTTYRLRSRLIGTFLPGHIGRKGEFIVPEFHSEFVGQGWNITEAFLDWRDRVHCRFQELNAKRPFELTEQERAAWRILESQIDVSTYRKTTPLMIRQIGKVYRARPRPEQIEWEDGHKESVRLDQVPGEFATFKPGQPFEAVVARDPVDFHLVKITHVRRTGLLPLVTADEREVLLQSIPTTTSLPEADWD